MTARFAQGMSIESTRRNSQESPVKTQRGAGRGKAGGLPGYIKTTADRSSGGLASSKPVGPRFNEGETTATTNKTVQMRDQGAYIGKRGPKSRSGMFDTAKFRGSSDKSYHNTSTGPEGKIRRLGEPKAPAKRGASETESGHGGTAGLRNAVSDGGVKGANKLPPQGLRAGGKNHTPGGGLDVDRSPAKQLRARNGGTQGGLHGSQFTSSPKGTMESLRGRAKMGAGKRTMY
jgi:hypothetical protein